MRVGGTPSMFQYVNVPIRNAVGSANKTHIDNKYPTIVTAGDERNCASQDKDNYVLAAFYI